MAVTELALLRLKPGVSLQDTALLASLRDAKVGLEKFSGHQFHYLVQTEDPTLVYIIGSWSSVAEHMEKWIPSGENQAILRTLGDHLSVEWMFHIGLDQSASPLPLDAAVIAVGRHFVMAEAQERLSDTFDAAKHSLERLTAPNPVSGGWRLEKETEGKAEWVLFTGWDDVDHGKFAASAEFAEYGQMLQATAGYEVRHARGLDVETGGPGQ